MTGYGRGVAGCLGGAVAAEVRSVNHKFCDVKLRIPRDFHPLESRIASAVRARLTRGHIEVSLRWSEAPPGREHVRADLDLARSVVDAYRSIGNAFGIGSSIDLALLAQHGVVEATEPSHAPDALWAGMSEALVQALDGCVAMREAEGAALARDLVERVEHLSRLRSQAANIAPRIHAETRDRFRERLQNLAEGMIDPARLAQEAAFLSERTDVSEELARLASHLEQFQRSMAAGEGVGRKLDFLCQELHREINTVGSKSQHVELTRIAVDFKSELEKLREQVQNIE
jgi:uncharacterized protein (TIGR00255 family)